MCCKWVVCHHSGIQFIYYKEHASIRYHGERNEDSIAIINITECTNDMENTLTINEKSEKEHGFPSKQ